MSTHVVICCGSGGVGKTTMSASLALKWAVAGQRVVVITIDPAKRLADSMGIDTIGNTPTSVPITQVDAATTGHLDAVMLDVGGTFEALIRQIAPTPEVAQRILDNRYFQFASVRLGGVHEFMAAEKVRELATSGQYDIVVVDTPPTRNALDFLTAPDRMTQLMDGAVMRWMAMPATKSGWRALELGSEAVAKVLRRLVGQGTVSDIAQFFDLFRGLWDGFHARSIEVHDMLRAPETRFFLVTTPAPNARSEALFFLDLIHSEGMPFGGFLVNRSQLTPVTELRSADLPSEGPLPPEQWTTLCEAITHVTGVQAQIADAHRRSVDALRAAGPSQAPCWCIPDLGHGIHDLTALASLQSHLPDSIPDV